MAVPKERHALWMLRLHLLGNKFLGPGDIYHGSIWHTWETRIQDGHKAEEHYIETRYEKRKSDLKQVDNPYFDPDQEAGEDYADTCQVTDAMYAALVVALWAEMEHFMKFMVKSCQDAVGIRKLAIEKMAKYCDEVLNKKKPTSKVEHLAKQLNKVHASLYKFDDLKSAVKETTSVNVEKCAAYPTVDAIRILNNSFKHSKGHYLPEDDKPFTAISKSLMSKWNIVNEHARIEYSKLNIQELATACNSFCADLLGKVKVKLNASVKRH